MRLRREDKIYAAATAVACGVVVYLTVGNFGLVPSPFAAPASNTLRPVEVPTFQALAASANQRGGPANAGAVPVIPGVSGRAAPAVPPPAPNPDTVAPAVKIGTPDDGAVISLSGDAIQGVASDDRSGVGLVEVTFTPSAGEAAKVVRADLACTAGLDCTWSAAPPAIAGTYSVEAKATDLAGNTATDGPRSVTVVEAQPEGGLVGGAVGTVTGVVDTLVGIVGGLL